MFTLVYVRLLSAAIIKIDHLHVLKSIKTSILWTKTSEGKFLTNNKEITVNKRLFQRKCVKRPKSRNNVKWWYEHLAKFLSH